jgi:hypothetical protein
MNDVCVLFYWCNGGHYLDVRQGVCPWSGYCNRGLLQQLKGLGSPDRWRTYQELLSAGLTEEDVLQLLLVPPERASSIAAVRCGEPATAELADLVAGRNRLVLELFPRGKLRNLLEQPASEAEYWYARLPGDECLWLLADETGLQRRANALGEDTAAVLARLAECMGVSWSEVQKCIANDGRAASTQLVLERFRVSEEFPSIGLDEECHFRGKRREHFRQRHYPVITAGHLIFPETESWLQN